MQSRWREAAWLAATRSGGYNNRFMSALRFKTGGELKIGLVKEWFRINKATEDTALLYSMKGNNSEHFYRDALVKVLNIQREKNQYPDTSLQSA